jgi:hypothetical protein
MKGLTRRISASSSVSFDIIKTLTAGDAVARAMNLQ